MKLTIIAVNLNTEEILELHGQRHTGETGLVRARISGFRPAPDTQCASCGYLCAGTFPPGKWKYSSPPTKGWCRAQLTPTVLGSSWMMRGTCIWNAGLTHLLSAIICSGTQWLLRYQKADLISSQISLLVLWEAAPKHKAVLLLFSLQGFFTKTLALMALPGNSHTPLSLSQKGLVKSQFRQAEISERSGMTQISSIC